MSGWPLRPDRDSFGPTFRDTTAVRDPTRQQSAQQHNLGLWQIAGMGLVSPRAMLVFTASVAHPILARAEAWNPKRLTTGAHADPTISRTGAGNYLVEYPSPVPDEEGEDAVLSFGYALAFPVNADPTTLKHAQAAVETGNTKQVRVCVFSNANALEDDNDVAVLIW